MKKCPSCNSSKYKENLIDGKLVRLCKRCGFVNKPAEDNLVDVKEIE